MGVGKTLFLDTLNSPIMGMIAKRGAAPTIEKADDTYVGNPRQDPNRGPPVDVVELDIGGWIFFPRQEAVFPQPLVGDAEVYESESLDGGYLTVRHTSGNDDEYEFCFRVEGGETGTAYLTTLTRVEDGKDCSRGWIPEEVAARVRMYYPRLSLEIA